MEGAWDTGGRRCSLGLFEAGGVGTAVFGGVFPPDTKTPCGTGFARGLGDWMLVVFCTRRGGVGSSFSDESDSDESDESEVASDEDSSSFSSRN